jgi:hypothetical protein
MKNFRPLFLFVALLLLVGMACSVLSGGGNAPSQPEQPSQPQQPQQVDTQAPAQTEAPTEAPAPTDPPAASEKYFTEEFDQDPAWDYFLTAGDKDKITVKFEDSLAKFDLEGTDIYAYYLYEAQEYDDVRIDMRAENRGRNNNNVSLVCRATTKGWYEFSTEGGGLWYLYGVTINDKKEPVYNRIDKGGTQALKQGKEVNDYGMSCKGDEITLYINDKKIKTITSTNYDFPSGYVGFNISSLNVTPIILNVDWFKISEP